ncbi:hypothetical protein Tco_0779380 [Tanacetum coccineum]
MEANSCDFYGSLVNIVVVWVAGLVMDEFAVIRSWFLVALVEIRWYVGVVRVRDVLVFFGFICGEVVAVMIYLVARGFGICEVGEGDAAVGKVIVGWGRLVGVSGVVGAVVL